MAREIEEKKPAKKKTAKTSPKKTENKKAVKADTKKKKVIKEEAPDDTKQKILSGEVKGILTVAIGVFLLFAFLSDAAGAVGSFLKNLFYGFFGVASAIGCIFVILTGIYIFLNKSKRSIKSNLIMLGGIVLSTSVLVALFESDTEVIGTGLIEQIMELYNGGIEGTGGGIIGSGLCRLFVMLIGVSGTWILAIATELILGIKITGVSLAAIIKKVSAKGKEKIVKRPKEEKETEPEQVEMKPQKGNFFGEYFTGKEPVEDKKKHPEYDDEDEDDTPIRRFEIKEDDELLKKFLNADDMEEEKADKKDDEEYLPFTIDNMKTGVLSELPVVDKDGVKAVKNPEDDEEFVPPSEAKLEDKFDPLTKKAVDAGVPLDRAVVKGRQMATEEAEELTPEKIIEKQMEEQSPPPRMMEYHLPEFNLLDPAKPSPRTRQEVKYELEEKGNRLLETLHSFKVDATIINTTQGPSVTRFELQPGFGVKVSKITSLTDDIALSLAAPGVRIEAPIPGKSAIGIEIPNQNPSPVMIREVLESEKFKNFHSKTAFALGKDIAGNCVVADIAKFPHVLIAGQTGSGKSVGINSLILSILYKAKPDEVKMIMVDPKMVELGIYNGIPHLLIPVVTDPKHAAGALNWAVGEMQNRYSLLKDNNVRNLKGYNALMEERGEPESKLPEIVIIIDEFADLMIAAKSEVEDAINRLAALARAAGMYLVIATQRPTVNVITGVIKANIPSRIAFKVTSQVDSRTILDESGADKLLGRGDMLYNPSGAVKPMRIQGNFVSDQEIERVINFIKDQYEASYDEEIIENIQKEQERVAANLAGVSEDDDEPEGMTRSGSEAKDELFIQAVEMVLDNGQASVAMFQRRFKIGYQRAARLIDQMEERRIIGPYEGTKPRQVLISRQEFLEMKMNEEG